MPRSRRERAAPTGRPALRPAHDDVVAERELNRSATGARRAANAANRIALPSLASARSTRNPMSSAGSKTTAWRPSRRTVRRADAAASVRENVAPSQRARSTLSSPATIAPSAPHSRPTQAVPP
jgi:hypothetical protein